MLSHGPANRESSPRRRRISLRGPAPGVGIAAMGFGGAGRQRVAGVPMIWLWRAERRARDKPLRGDRVLMTG